MAWRSATSTTEPRPTAAEHAEPAVSMASRVSPAPLPDVTEISWPGEPRPRRSTSVVDLKFPSFRWQPRLGTSNPNHTRFSMSCQCAFESEIRPKPSPRYSEFRFGTLAAGGALRRRIFEVQCLAGMDERVDRVRRKRRLGKAR